MAEESAMVEESGVLYIETNRLGKFCPAMRGVVESVFHDLDRINSSLEEFGKDWEGNLRDNFFLVFEDAKSEAAQARALWQATLEKFEQASAAYNQLEQQIESLGTSQS